MKNSYSKMCLCFIFISIFSLQTAKACIAGVESQQQQNHPDLTWFKQAKFGLFLHWGLYSIPAGEWKGQKYFGIGEWLMHRAEIPIQEYKKLAKEFNPVKFNADNWVRYAKNAGMKYIVLTAKHCEGFSMFDTDVSGFNIMDASPYKRDIVKELADACHREGIKIGLYYPQEFEWLDPDARGNTWDYPNRDKNLANYLNDTVKPQLRELLTNYGEISIIWFDVPNWITRDQSQDLANFVHNLQPQCLVNSRIGNNKGDYLSLGDAEIPTTVLNEPWETAATLNGTWGYVWFDQKWKSTTEILQKLLSISSKGGNYLLNIGPTAEGILPPASISVLQNIAEWMKANSKSIHGCLPSPLGHLPWGECTAKPEKIFLHVFKWPVSGTLIVPGLKNKINRIHYLHSDKKLDYSQTDNDVYITVDAKMPYPMNTVIVIEFQGNPITDKTQTILQNNQNVLQAATAKCIGNVKLVTRRWMEEFGDWKYADCLDGWKGMTDRAGWEFRTLVPGEYSIELTYSCKRKDGFKQGICTIGDSQLFFESFDTGEQQVDRQRPDGFTDHPMQFKTYAIGRVVLPEARRYKLTVKPANETDGFFALKSVHLVPYK